MPSLLHLTMFQVLVNCLTFTTDVPLSHDKKYIRKWLHTYNCSNCLTTVGSLNDHSDLLANAFMISETNIEKHHLNNWIHYLFKLQGHINQAYVYFNCILIISGIKSWSHRNTWLWVEINYPLKILNFKFNSACTVQPLKNNERIFVRTSKEI